MTEVYLLSLGSKDDAGYVLALTHFPCVIGRHSACDHRINDPEVSRRHCAFALRDDQLWVEDLRSLNGTRLNGTPLTEARPLADGDRLELGPLIFQVWRPQPGVDIAAGEEVVYGTEAADRPDPDAETRRGMAPPGHAPGQVGEDSNSPEVSTRQPPK